MLPVSGVKFIEKPKKSVRKIETKALPLFITNNLNVLSCKMFPAYFSKYQPININSRLLLSNSLLTGFHIQFSDAQIQKNFE